jgi:TRAP-type C4-dicarboxylate transport system permease small subunit
VTTPSKQRTQIYAALLALMMLGLAFTCAQLGVKAWQQTGPTSAWLSLVVGALLAAGAVALLFSMVRSVRASFKNVRRRASRNAGEMPGSETPLSDDRSAR